MAIAFKKVSYVYSPEMPYAFRALNEIDLDFAMDKITSIVGETGSGKSTLVQHLNALLIPSEGEVEVLDHVIKAYDKNKGLKALRFKIGLVFQFSEYQLFEETILKDVAFGPKNFGDSEEVAIKKAKAALKLVGLDESCYERSPLEISGGQKRRVAIAGILAMDPSVIVLDEPTAGLDPKGAKEMIELFSRLNKEHHKTIILVSHDNEVVYRYSDDVVMMEKGKVVYHGDSKSFFEQRENIERFHLLPPQVVNFKNALEERGFVLTSFDFDTIIKEVVKQVNHE